MAAIETLLRPNILSRLVSRQMVAEQWILGFFGFESGGRNELNLGHGREGTFDVFDNTRKVGEGRIPGTAAAVVQPQRVGVVRFDYPRMHESIQLPAEKLHNLRRIGDENVRDVAGTRMIELQTQYAAQRAANFRAALTIGMLRDSLYLQRNGDSLYPTFTDPTTNGFQIDFQQPAGNKSQLDMLGDGDIIDVSWDNPTADIPKHLGSIDAAFQELYGGRLENVWVQNSLWQYIIKNDHVASQAGIANTPFQNFDRVVGTRADGSPVNVKTGVLSCEPNVTFWITDEGIEIGARGSEAFTKYVPDNTAFFLPNPDMGTFFMQLGSEPIAEFDGGPETVQTGLYSWANKTYNPTNTNIFTLDNALAINDIPNSVAHGTVVF